MAKIFAWQRSPRGLIPVIYHDEIMSVKNKSENARTVVVVADKEIPPELENASIKHLALHFADIVPTEPLPLNPTKFRKIKIADEYTNQPAAPMTDDDIPGFGHGE